MRRFPTAGEQCGRYWTALLWLNEFLRGSFDRSNVCHASSRIRRMYLFVSFI